MSQLSNRPTARPLRKVAIVAGAGAAVIGLFFFLSWMSGAMTYLGLRYITVKTNASLCQILCGLGILLLVEPVSPRRRWAAGGLAALALLIGLLTLLEHVLSLDLGIDQLLAAEPAGALGVSHPNRMGPPGAASFTLCGAALLLLINGKRESVRTAQGLGIALCLIALLASLGYLFDVTGLYGVARYTGIAWQTVLAVALLGVGVLCLRSHEGLMAAVTAVDAGGVTIRRLLLPATILPIILAWLARQGDLHGLYEPNYGITILVLSWIVIFSVLVFQTGKRLGVIAHAEQKATEQLQRTQALLLEAERLSHTGAWEWDLVTGQWNMSDEWLRIHGISDRTFTPEKLLAIAHPDDRPAIQAAFNALRDGTRPYHIEHRIIRQDTGEIGIVRAQGQIVKDSAGRVARVYGFAQDITEQKRAEEEAKLQRELLEAVVQHMPAAIMIVRGSDLRVLMINPAYAQLAPGKAVVDKTLQELWPELPELADIFRTVLDTGEAYFAFDAPYRISKGPGQPREERFFSWSVYRVQLPGNQGLGLLNTAWETTYRKESEEALRLSEQKFRAVFQQAAVGMGRVRFSDARWIDVNDAFCHMVGYSAEEMLATPWPEITYPEDVDKDLTPFHQMAAGELENYSLDKRFIHKDGHHVWARLTLSLVRDALGQPDYEIAIIQDITENKRAEEALRRAKEELELRVRERTRELEQAYGDLKRETEERIAAVEDLRKNEQLLIQQSRLAAMGEMLGNIAHQWRQPLNILGLLIQQLSVDYEIGNFDREHLDNEVDKAMQVILHMSQTINDFQNFLQEDREKNTFNVNQVVVTTLSLSEATLKTMDVKLEVIQRDEVFATGFRNEFSQVVMNIITNARDAFRERRTPCPKIVIEIFKERERSVVTITDNAGGIPEEIIGKIFDPYFTTKGPDRGTGIGLFMSKNIIEKSMNGALLVRNTGEGAEFRIEVSG